MKRMPFKRPTDHYDERICSIDEQLCELMGKRKEISNNNPGYPPLEHIANWAKRFNLYEDLLKSIFGSLWNEENHKAFVEPNEFRMNLSVLKYVEKDNRIFSVLFIRQYDNASIINFNIYGDVIKDSVDELPQHYFYKLSIGQQYDCRMNGGGGSSEHYSYSFIVSPPLPDDVSGIELVFKEYKSPARDKATGLEIAIHLE